ncbi:MAG: flagellin [Planctomycetes bacterium]|nr:flagellin [Planctomycetota bacterium]
MSRINTNVTAISAQRMLNSNKLMLNTSLERLSTGLRINRGGDDPAGLIASNNLSNELKGLNAAIANSERADQVVGIAEGGLQEVSGMLEELQGLVTASASDAGLSKEEKQANQLQIDSILQTIDRIASATSFQGIKLLNGNFDFRTSGVSTGVSDFKINSAKFNTDSLNVDVQVTQSAQQAGLVMSMGGTTLAIGTSESFVVEITGSKGSRQLSFANGTTANNIMSAINTYSDITGVEATTSGGAIKVVSEEFGSSEFVNIKIIDDGGLGSSTGGVYQMTSNAFGTTNTSSRVALDASAASNGIRDEGQNVRATVNGVAATSDGKRVRVSTDFLDVDLTLTDSRAQSNGTFTGLTVTGGGASFQLAGKVDIGGKVALGINDVAVRKLGSSALGYLSDLASGKDNNVVDGDVTDAQRVVEEATKQVSALRGRLGAFQKNVIGATTRSLNVAAENTTAAQSTIRDANFATETANLTRAQILVSSSTQILSLANQQPQGVLQLLG